MKNIMWNKFYQTIAINIFMLTLIAGCGSFILVEAQDLPDEAALPAGKGAWVIDQFYHSNVIKDYAAATTNNTRILVQSDGIVFRRRIIQYSTFANDSGWCRDQFTNEEMRGVRAAIGKFKPGIWQDYYGPLPNSLSPFGSVTITMRDANGKAVDYAIKLFRFDNLPADLVNLLNKVGEAGDLAFSNCQKSNPVKEEKVEKKEEKVEIGAAIYAINRNGDLLWYNHTGFENGERVWANNAKAKNVGYEWSGNVKIFKSDPQGRDGIIYTVTKEGYLSWYKHNGYASGLTDWETPKNVGTGFNGRYVFSGDNGVIYMIDNAGDLYWYKHLGYQNGTKSWANNGAGKKVKSGWNDARQVFSGGDGVIYMIDSRGDLYWNKHLGFHDGTIKWSEQKKIGSGWQNLRQIFSIGDGIIYALQTDGILLWQKHEGFAIGAVSWANGGLAKTIGSGWNFDFVF